MVEVEVDHFTPGIATHRATYAARSDFAISESDVRGVGSLVIRDLHSPITFFVRAAMFSGSNSFTRAWPASMSAAIPPADPEQIAAARQRREVLAAALEALAPDRARAVRAHLGGWSAHEIMDLTGWSYQKTQKLMTRGMADLRALLIARGAQ